MMAVSSGSQLQVVAREPGRSAPAPPAPGAADHALFAELLVAEAVRRVDVGELDAALALLRRCSDLDQELVPPLLWAVPLADAAYCSGDSAGLAVAAVAVHRALQGEEFPLRDRVIRHLEGLLSSTDPERAQRLIVAAARAYGVAGEHEHAARALVHLALLHSRHGRHGHSLQALRAAEREGALAASRSMQRRIARGLQAATGQREVAAPSDPDADRTVVHAGWAELTVQERAVAQAVAAGASNREVADDLCITIKTVESHLTSAFRKLGIRRRTQLVRMALHAPGRVVLDLGPPGCP